MTRRRPPTDEQKTSIYDSGQRARGKKETRKGFESGEIELPTPTEIDPVGAAPTSSPREKSEPIRVISMKTPAQIAAEKQKVDKKKHQVEIRALSDVARQNTPPRGMGNLAPPVDYRQRRQRRLRDWLIWGSVLVIISCVVMLGVWFLAGR
jgi:hypothetical protein